MVKKFFKWTGILIASLLVILLLFFAFVYVRTEARANKIYNVTIQQLTIPNDSASYALGEHIAYIRGCNECHANGGVAFLDEKNPIGLLYAANLTNGKGGIHYTDKDWIRALRHGVGRDGKSLWFMPAQHTSAALSNRDLGALISYLKQWQPVDTEHPKKAFKPLGRILTCLNKFPMFPAEFINHDASYPDEVKPEASVAYGVYLAVGCQGCHGENLKGSPPRKPGEPPIPDISSTGNPGKWTSEQFITALHTGNTPDGRLLSDFMPWRSVGKAHTEEELRAIFLYLKQTK